MVRHASLFSQLVALFLLEARNMSGYVAHDLSGLL